MTELQSIYTFLRLNENSVNQHLERFWPLRYNKITTIVRAHIHTLTGYKHAAAPNFWHMELLLYKRRYQLVYFKAWPQSHVRFHIWCFTKE